MFFVRVHNSFAILHSHIGHHMKFDDLFLDISLQGNRKTYKVRSLGGDRITLGDLAARMERDVSSVYQLLRGLPLGTHGVPFQEIIRKSASRKHHGYTTNDRKVLADNAGVAAINAALKFMRHHGGCAVDKYQQQLFRWQLERQEWQRKLNDWKAEEIARKGHRDSGGQSPHIPPPAEPMLPRLGSSPACDCGCYDAERAARDAMDRFTLAPESSPGG